MGAVPGALLRHTVVVYRYLAWDTYAAGETIRCFLGQRLSTAATNAGVERIGQLTIIAAPGTDLPAGSRVTLADGRQGYIQAVVAHDGGGLPTPDHVEAAVVVGSQHGPAFGETVWLLRRAVAPGRDAYGNDRYTTTSVEVRGCAVRALSSQETTEGFRDRVTDAVEVIMPPGTVVTATDRLVVRGLTYEVDGTPDTQASNVTGVQPGVRIVARRITG